MTTLGARIGVLLAAVWTVQAVAQAPALTRSEVVFMYQSDRPTYSYYGATMVAWGGRPTAASLEAADGLKFCGSVGMVTEFARYYDRFPDSYEQGLCRDLEGKPYRVPWLTDHQHRGVPFWWCCTRQPVFRRYLEERVADTVKAGAWGVHIDDHLGTAGSLWLGGCFCDRCVAEFPAFLKECAEEEVAAVGFSRGEDFNCRDALREWKRQNPNRKLEEHPGWRLWRAYQLRGAARFMGELRALAAKTAGREIPLSANAGVLWPNQLSDCRTLDFLSAEIEHRAGDRRFSDRPTLAYRLADAVAKPLASTASGQDWAFIKEENRPGLVRLWIAQGYAAGHSLMVPHHQWCYTEKKGTHWYDGPKSEFAPLYQFVRQHRELFDDYTNHADLTIAFSHRTFCRDAERVIRVGAQLAAANLSYRVALGGDEILDWRLPDDLATGAEPVLMLERQDFSPADRERLPSATSPRHLADAQQACARIRGAVVLDTSRAIRAFPRVKPGAAVVHLVNGEYDAAQDRVTPATDLRVVLDLKALGVAGATEARLLAPGVGAKPLPIRDSALVVPKLDLWAILELKR